MVAKTKGRLFYVTGPSGAGVRSALEGYCDYLRKIGAEDEVPVVLQLEDERFYAAAAGPLASAFPELSGQPTLYDILRLPKPSLAAIWKELFDSLLTEAREAMEDGKDVVLTFHAIWFHHQNREYISVVDFRALEDERASAQAVITFIDDIFDVLVRLSQENGLFAARPLAGANSLVDRTEKLLRILDWRAHEQLISEKIADMAAGGQHFLLAVKHPYVTLRQLLSNPASTKVYLSHPITKPRGMLETDERGAAQAEITSIQAMAAKLRECAIVFEPTTIDELRFRRLSKGVLPILTPRWPASAAGELLWNECVVPDDLGDEWRAVAEAAIGGDEEALKELEVAIPLLEILADAISRHINLRDHKLVDQCDFVVVYRPFYLGEISTGVLQELSYYARLSKLGIKGDACIVLHPPLDESERPVVVAQSFVGGRAPGQMADAARLRAAARQQAAHLQSSDDLEIGRALDSIASDAGLSLNLEGSGGALRAETASQLQEDLRLLGQSYRQHVTSYLDSLPEGTVDIVSDDISAEIFADRVCEAVSRAKGSSQ